ncbi:uncharacterized protein F4807DRAFT_416056 [Annulohypoxylon truncatum]|uniref:uncharacterized protein n=1 Tax=Annulohypoxylon truncatum TaxID=327061 RepID=UPI0020089D52|nr:uncharacterized protein F4807DRAFT_416056 [Annulohypoxylon truncatum]KAI1212422.1 hypothetical protein F4807DRAFT_416056 [Annulohypoxylon truncatum]
MLLCLAAVSCISFPAGRLASLNRIIHQLPRPTPISRVPVVLLSGLLTYGSEFLSYTPPPTSFCSTASSGYQSRPGPLTALTKRS